jgi:hypothetical protein
MGHLFQTGEPRNRISDEFLMEDFWSRQEITALSGLPDGLFSYQKIPKRVFLEGPRMENVGIFYDYILQPSGIFYINFGTVCGHWVYLSRLGMFGTRKIWQPRALL